MSRILELRENIEAWVRETCPELREVDWYDGQFDITDLRNWVAKPPCAFLAASVGEDELVVTGESQINLDCVLVFCDQDKKAGRDADRRVWQLMERTAIGLRLQSFGNENATPSWGVSMRRLMDPVIRREGVAFGLVRWRIGITIGENKARERDIIYDDEGRPITAVPPRLGYHTALYAQALEEGELDEEGSSPQTEFELPLPNGLPRPMDERGFFVGAGYEP